SLQPLSQGQSAQSLRKVGHQTCEDFGPGSLTGDGADSFKCAGEQVGREVWHQPCQGSGPVSLMSDDLGGFERISQSQPALSLWQIPCQTGQRLMLATEEPDCLEGIGKHGEWQVWCQRDQGSGAVFLVPDGPAGRKGLCKDQRTFAFGQVW